MDQAADLDVGSARSDLIVRSFHLESPGTTAIPSYTNFQVIPMHRLLHGVVRQSLGLGLRRSDAGIIAVEGVALIRRTGGADQLEFEAGGD